MYKTSFLLICLISLSFSVLAQNKDKKWDVNNPEATQGMTYKEVSFEVTEGTWMNLDISPDGKTLAFDLLGDIYTLPISGGNATCLRSGIAWEVQPRWSPDGKRILFTSDAGGGDNIWLMQADGQKAKQVTQESFRLLNNPSWMPSGDYFVARKHFTSTRSLGAGEMWMYHISGGEGVQLTKRKNDQQDVNEPSVSADGKYLYFSEDLYPGGNFQYNKDPNNQIFAVRRYDFEKGKIEEITGGSGGACRPQISHNGIWLAFVRRVAEKSMLFLQNVQTGEEYPVYDQLDKDQQEAWTIFGCYPGYAWSPNDGEIVIWAGGKIKRISLGNALKNEAVALDDKGFVKNTVSEIPFSCTVHSKIAETLRFKNPVFEKEFTAKAIRHAITSPDGKLLVFNAAGQLYSKKLPNGKPNLLLKNAWRTVTGRKTDDLTALNVADEPTFTPDGKQVVFVVWDDDALGKISKLNLETNEVTDLTTEKGIYRTPSISPDGNKLVFLKQDGDDELGFAFCKNPGIYIMDFSGGKPVKITDEGENPRFSADGKRIYVNTGSYLFGGLDKSLKSFDLNGKDEMVHFKSKYSNQWVPSPDGKWLAFTELHKAYICTFPASGKTIDLSAETKAVPVSQISRDAGYNLHWAADSKSIHWTLGESYFTTDLNKRFSFLPEAPDSLPALDTTGLQIGLMLKADMPEGYILFNHARIITMEGDQVIEDGALLVDGNTIAYVGPSSNLPDRKTKPYVVDCAGKTIMPGIVDVHAHSGNFRYGLNPQKQWEYYANLAYGVTTMHDPSTNSEMAFSNSEMLKKGALVGPRLFSTGTILYGADGDFKAPINSLDDARSTLRRTKAWGAFSVKSYNQPRREQRQQVIAAARELKMEVVPEGGSFFYHNLTQVVDGHTGIEHNIPVAPVYSDVLELWKRTRAHNTPTLIVCYAAMTGESYFYQKTDVWTKKRLLKYTPKHVIDSKSRHRTMIPDSEYENGFVLVSKSCKKMQDAGININLGAHGQLQGLGAHWELWMLQKGGMSNHQALKCATINGAQYLGMEAEIGSLKQGKLADLIVLNANPLEEITNSENIHSVMVNGRLYDPETMNEIGNSPTKRSLFWFEKPGSHINGAHTGMHTCGNSGCVCGH